MPNRALVRPPEQGMVYGTRGDGTFGPLGEEGAKATVNSQSREGVPQEPRAQNPAVSRQEPLVGSEAKAAAKQAISAKLAAEDQIGQSARIADQASRDAGLTGNDAVLFRDALEHPDEAGGIDAQSSNPDAFAKAMERYRGFTNDVYRVGKQAGRDYPFRSNYYNHEYDLSELQSHPEANAEYQSYVAGKLGEQRNAGSSSELPRVFNDLREAKGYGEYLQQKYGLENNPFIQKNGSVAEDIRDLAQRSQRAVGASALTQKLQQIAPNDVAIGSQEKVPPGFLQLHVHGLQDTFVSPELYGHLKVLEPSAFQDNPIVHAVDTVNRTLKGVVLQGPFHAIKETINFTGDQLAGLKLPNFVHSTGLALSPSKFADYLQGLKESGFLDTASKLNLKLGGTDFEDLSKGQLSMHSMTFGRLIPYYKLESLQTALGNAGLDLSTPEGLAEGKKVAAQVNNFYGGLNNELNGRNKTTQQILRFAALAPDFNEGKLRTGANALLDWNTPAGTLARKQLLGSAAVTALGVEMARRFSTGKWDGLKDGLQNTVLNPNVPLPSSFDKPGSAIQQTAQVPGSVGADLYRFATNPAQALQSRGSSLISLGDKIVSGKDYYGNPLVNPFTNPNPSLLDNAKAALANELPIPAQAEVNALEGKSSQGSALINALGGRVANNPQDPKEMANVAYYNSLGTFTKGLNPNEQALLGTVMPVKKDQDGNPVFNKAATTSAANAAQLASQPAFAQKFARFQEQNGSLDPIYKLDGDTLINALQARAAVGLGNKSSLDPNAPSASTSANTYLKNFPLFQGQQAYEKLAGDGNYDPLYNLPDSQAKQVLYVRTLSGVEATGDPTATAIKAQPWYKQFETIDQAWYNAHPLPASATTTSSINSSYPAMPSTLSQYATYISGLPTSSAKAQAYNTTQGQALDAYYAKLDQYNSQKQATLLGTPENVAAGSYSPGYTASPATGSAIPASAASAIAALNLPAGGSSGSGSSSSSAVEKALTTSAEHRAARKVLSSMSSPKAKHGKIRAPRFKPVNTSSHASSRANLPSESGFVANARLGKVKRPAARVA